MNRNLVFLVTALVGLSMAQAAVAKDSGFFIGGSVGSGTVTAKGTIPGGGDFKFDESDFAWKIFGGYTFGSWLGIEGGYVDFGGGDGSFGTSGDTAKADVTGFDLFGVVGLPLGPVRIFGKLGGIYWDGDVKFSDGSPKESDDGFDIGGGLGLELSIASIAVRAEVEYFDALDDLYMLSIGATWTF